MAAKATGAPKSVDRDTAVDHAAAKHKQATGRDVGTDNARARAAEAGEPQGNGNAKADAAAAKEANTSGLVGETITQTKRSIKDDGIDNRTMDSIGQGSVTEEAPAVRGSEAPVQSQRVLQQGDDVMLTTKNPINGATENRGKVLKVNQDSTIAVRVDLGNGQTQDFTGVQSSRTEDGNPFWQWMPDAA